MIQFHMEDMQEMKNRFGENLIFSDAIVDKDEALDFTEDIAEDLLDNQEEAVDLTKTPCDDSEEIWFQLVCLSFACETPELKAYA